MRNTLLALSLGLLSLGPQTALADQRGIHEVVGVKGEDMLKLRSGPGVGYTVIVGLPNGAEVWVQSCERSGNTSWCKVSLKAARGLKGYVSSAYLRKK
ncbi:SH3 domain-containing protein [Xinfangfangia sp. CPCC 101601]|uniref:SH3 domain-containing protein n=1 Tax=Pseudogemmobacter lacusdianii TaxID=3069608 RepID=A0ABU0VYQ1_9RHOB|nr:SH3 domain-containing protein [Xinfangfangia sp. CPCC 101601]MDQ2066839.1 SH3 domain-containing protein [Xinfangfangia sp. CPCC 101601]